MSFARDLVKSIADKNTTVLEDGLNSSEVSEFYDTGSYIFNALLSGSLYGGAPGNKITMIAGEPATGKTYFCLGIAKAFLDLHDDGVLVFYDTESAVTQTMMTERGIDPSRVIVVEPVTVQDCRTHILNTLEKYTEMGGGKLMMVLDSLGNLSTAKEVEDSTAGSDTRDMTRAALVKAMFRVITLKLAKAQVPLFVTNHVYDNVGNMFNPVQIGGGKGAKYLSSTVITLSKSKDKYEKGDAVNIKATTAKSRLTKENRQAIVRLRYDSGLDRYFGLLDLAEKYDIMTPSSGRYEMPDGSKVFGKTITQEPEKYFTSDIMARLEEAAIQEFKYGEADREVIEPLNEN